MRQLHISQRSDKMLCGVADVSGTLRRYLTAPATLRHDDYEACPRCAELEPLVLLARADLEGSGIDPCRAFCGRPGTHYASYDGRWTCEQCIV